MGVQGAGVTCGGENRAVVVMDCCRCLCVFLCVCVCMGPCMRLCKCLCGCLGVCLSDYLFVVSIYVPCVSLFDYCFPTLLRYY